MKRVFDHPNHKKLWLWLAENPSKYKYDWPEWEENGGEIAHAQAYCFACEYTDENGDCDECPLEWSPCPSRCDLFHVWDSARDLNKRSELAKQIAYLPVKEGVVCK